MRLPELGPESVARRRQVNGDRGPVLDYGADGRGQGRAERTACDLTKSDTKPSRRSMRVPSRMATAKNSVHPSPGTRGPG